MKRYFVLRNSLLAFACLGLSAANAQDSTQFDTSPADTATISKINQAPPPGHNPVTHKKTKGKSKKHFSKPTRGVEQSLAIRQTAAPEMELPGVMTIKGSNARALDFSRARVLPFFNGSSHTVWLSKSSPNLVTLPFENPKIVGRSSLIIDKSEESNNIYVSFDPKFNPDEKHPEQIFIEAPNRTVIALLLVPKDIPAQTILIEDHDKSANKAGAKRSDSYVANIQDIMETLATGGIPAGFTAIDLSRDKGIGPVAMHGLVITPLKKLSGFSNDIFVYEATNPGAAPAKLMESEFDSPAVAAISIHPKPVLASGESAKIFVMTRKDAEE